MANNIVKFNLSVANPASSTATEIISVVPSGTTSGPIRVRTPYGAATSSEDFFVPPSGYTPAQVGRATRIAVDGPPLVISTGSAGKIAMLLFDGVQGQGLGLGMSPVTFASAGGGNASVRIYSPLGTEVFSSSFSAATSFDLPLLPVSGTYTMVIIPPATASLSAILTLSSDLAGTLTPGSVQTFSTARVGQNARYSFTGTQGQNRSLLFSGNVFPGYTYAYVYKPDGTQLNSTFLYYAGSGAATSWTLFHF